MIWFISSLNLESFPWEIRNYILSVNPCVSCDRNAILFMFTKKNIWNVIQFHFEASDAINTDRYKIPFFLEEFYVILNKPDNFCNLHFWRWTKFSWNAYKPSKHSLQTGAPEIHFTIPLIPHTYSTVQGTACYPQWRVNKGLRVQIQIYYTNIYVWLSLMKKSFPHCLLYILTAIPG